MRQTTRAVKGVVMYISRCKRCGCQDTHIPCTIKLRMAGTKKQGGQGRAHVVPTHAGYRYMKSTSAPHVCPLDWKGAARAPCDKDNCYSGRAAARLAPWRSEKGKARQQQESNPDWTGDRRQKALYPPGSRMSSRSSSTARIRTEATQR